MPAFSISFHTLGCKLNQLETESIVQAFRTEGFSVVPWGKSADIYLVNTCTVTSMAEQKARREIRKALRDHPGSCVIATGCYAQLNPEALYSIGFELNAAFGSNVGEAALDPRRITVVSGDLKSSLLDLPAFISDSACSSAELPEILADWSSKGGSDKSEYRASVDPFRFDANDFSFHSRASLKIQDGCDNACAYCRVRLARGRSVSLFAKDILARLRELENRGYAEAVLTGINISRYRDSDGVDFPDLLKILIEGTSRIALRISSTEPDSVDERFAEAAAHPRIRPHFHLSVQSGSDAVLKRMRRRYASSQVFRAAELLRKSQRDPFMACDIIAGFPGETEDDFNATMDLCRTIRFSWIHAFPFSPRPGTDAESMPDRVPERESGKRVASLLELAKRGREDYLARWIGKEIDAVAEGRAIEPANANREDAVSFQALSANYLKLLVSYPSSKARPKPGTAIRCRISSIADDLKIFDAYAELLEIFC